MNLNEEERRVFMKCAEELSELSTVILQELNKNKCKYHSICQEVEDVDLRLSQVKIILKNETRE